MGVGRCRDECNDIQLRVPVLDRCIALKGSFSAAVAGGDIRLSGCQNLLIWPQTFLCAGLVIVLGALE